MSSLGFITTALTTLSVGAIFWVGMGDAAAQDINSNSDVISSTSGEAISTTLTEFLANGGRQMTFRPFTTPTLSPPSSHLSNTLVAGTVTSAHGDAFADAHNPDVDLRIQPRFNVGHTSSGAWLNGLTRIDAWIPVRQQIGEDITFVEPHFNIDNKGYLGGSILLGHREYDSDDERLWAGYAAWDIRETEHDTFQQLGLGIETLGDTWDVHLNGYIPLGDRTETFDESFFGTDGIVSSSGFEGNLLVLSERQEQSRFFREEVALGGFDIGATVELAEWDEGDGDLRALAGLYYLGGPSVDDDLGWRLGLEVRPVEQIVLGFTVQDDDIFGTNILASITASLRRVRPKDDVLEEFEEPFEVVERLGEPIRRHPTIAVATVEDIETTITEVEEPLYNPQNGTDENPGAYRFVHVSLGASENGDGTFESPYNNIDDAIADASQNSGAQFGNPETAENQIIYVDASASNNINAFEIPAGVRVLSQAPIQVLNGSNNSFSTFPTVEGRLPFSPDNNFNTGIAGEESGIVVTLPGSGDNDFPLVNSGADNLITMNSNTVLSGFRLENATANAIFATDADNVEIRDSFITTAGERGIYLDNVGDSVILFDNEISDISGGTGSGQGIFINNTTTNVEVVARNQIISNTRIGIDIEADSTSGSVANQIVEIESSTVSDSLEQGILLFATGAGSNQQVVIDSTSVTGNGSEGIRIEAQSIGSQEIIIQDTPSITGNSVISNNGDAGIRIIGGTLNNTPVSTAAQEIFIFESTIANNGGPGIDIEGNERATQEFGIRDNVITNNAGDGIQAVANNIVFQEFVTDSDNNSLGISGNIITGNSGQGIDLDANNSATQLSDIQNNVLSNTATTSGNAELEITGNSNTIDVCAYVFQNNATTNGLIIFDNNSSGVAGLFEVVDLNGTTVLSSNTTNSGTVSLLPNETAFTEKIGTSNSCFTEVDAG